MNIGGRREFWVFLLTGLIAACMVGCDPTDSPPVFDRQVEFPELGSTVYMRSRTWGLAGNHEETRMELEPVDNAVPCRADQCVIIFASEAYYKKEGRDKLIIYAISSSVPKTIPDAIGEVKLTIVEVRDHEELRKKAVAKGLSRTDR